MKDHDPIGLHGDYLILHGNARRQEDKEEALLMVGLPKGDLHAVLFSQGKFQLFSDAEGYANTPSYLRQWVLMHQLPRNFLTTRPAEMSWTTPLVK